MGWSNASMNEGHNDEVRQMIEALPPGSSQYDAEGLGAEDLEELLQRDRLFTHTEHYDSDGKRILDSYVVFKNVARDTMRDFSNQRHLGRIKDQSLTNHLLIINMPSGDHESAIRYFDKVLQRKLDEMRTDFSLEMKACGSKDVHGTTRTKIPDTSFRPRLLPAARSDEWPSLVLEVFRNHRVHLEMWQFRDGAARPRPVLTQEATVTKSASGYSASAPMVIRFQDLLLRPPAGNGECDIVLDRGDLEQMVKLALD
ncbi:predicted protein [Histoplasma mississippiense (nom. inval.)]|uniref:predicted protein n=1 Tax=Ajellomyces capsulatus (strain NAm1 / WU24) TaxID=2059318 RepID=UPI000157C1A8|nr:predicted protein [Histoplasma mississippiense (nom. inval.)]EDN07801.1 predicted protein [Histoplasma mississippiense (nom. inval.)]